MGFGKRGDHSHSQTKINKYNKLVQEAEAEEEDIDLFHTQFAEDDESMMWLSGSSSSSSSYFHFSVDEWLTSWLSLYLDSYLFLGKVITINPTAKDAEKKDSQKQYRSMEEEATDANDFLISELDRNNFWESLVNLENEASELISEDSELAYFDCFKYGFLSPSHIDNTCSASSWTSTEIEDLEEVDNIIDNEPLFWPFDQKFDWDNIEEEDSDCFPMSPRKDIIRTNVITTPPSTSSKVVGLITQHGGKNRMGVKEGCKRSLVFPSSLCKLTNNSVKIARGNVDSLEEEDFASNYDEVPIETLLGLCEFDGHEGVDFEFDNTIFFLS